MQYKQYDIELKSGDIVLFSNAFKAGNPMRWLSMIIRWATSWKVVSGRLKYDPARYNHVAVVVENWGTPELNEAVWLEIKGRPAWKYLHRHLTRIKVLRYRTPINEAYFCQRANSKKGIPYDVWALPHHLWYRLSGRWVGSTEAKSEGKMVCSEYAAWCYELPNWWAYSAKELESHPDFVTVFEE